MGGYRASLRQRRISSSPAERERLLERDDDAFEAPSPLSFSKRLINEVGRLVQVVYPLLNRYVPRYRPIPPPRTAGVQLFKYALIILHLREWNFFLNWIKLIANWFLLLFLFSSFLILRCKKKSETVLKKRFTNVEICGREGKDGQKKKRIYFIASHRERKSDFLS